jgi:hypothetical protein
LAVQEAEAIGKPGSTDKKDLKEALAKAQSVVSSMETLKSLRSVDGRSKIAATMGEEAGKQVANAVKGAEQQMATAVEGAAAVEEAVGLPPIAPVNNFFGIVGVFFICCCCIMRQRRLSKRRRNPYQNM